MMLSSRGFFVMQLYKLLFLLPVAFSLPLNTSLEAIATNATILTAGGGLSIPGQANLFVDGRFTQPLSILTDDALFTLSSLQTSLVRDLPGHLSLDKLRFKYGPESRVWIEPSSLGTGPMQRTDPTWKISNLLAAQVLGEVARMLRRSTVATGGAMYSVRFWVFERDFQGRSSRGVVAFGIVTSDVGALRGDDGGQIVEE